MLRLVHPAPEGQATRPRKGRRSPAFLLSADEERHLRVTLKNLARAYGGVDVLAGVIGITASGLAHAIYGKRRRLSAGVALLAARAAGSTVEAVLGGKLTAAGRCPTCGSRVGDKPATRAS